MKYIFYLYDSEPHEANNGFTDCVLWGSNLNRLLEYDGYADCIWAVELKTGKPLLIAEWRSYVNWDVTGMSEALETWYHPGTRLPFLVTNWIKFSKPLDLFTNVV